MTAVHIARVHRTQERFEPLPMFVDRRVQQRRVPPPASIHCQRTHSYRLPKQAQLMSCVSLQAQYQAFVHFAVGEQRSSNGHRAQQDLRLGTFNQ